MSRGRLPGWGGWSRGCSPLPPPPSLGPSPPWDNLRIFAYWYSWSRIIWRRLWLQLSTRADDLSFSGGRTPGFGAAKNTQNGDYLHRKVAKSNALARIWTTIIISFWNLCLSDFVQTTFSSSILKSLETNSNRAKCKTRIFIHVKKWIQNTNYVLTYRCIIFFYLHLIL